MFDRYNELSIKSRTRQNLPSGTQTHYRVEDDIFWSI